MNCIVLYDCPESQPLFCFTPLPVWFGTYFSSSPAMSYEHQYYSGLRTTIIFPYRTSALDIPYVVLYNCL